MSSAFRTVLGALAALTVAVLIMALLIMPAALIGGVGAGAEVFQGLIWGLSRVVFVAFLIGPIIWLYSSGPRQRTTVIHAGASQSRTKPVRDLTEADIIRAMRRQGIKRLQLEKDADGAPTKKLHPYDMDPFEDGDDMGD